MSSANRAHGGEEAPPADLPRLHAGMYRHYKGGLYQVLGYGHDANHPGRTVVVYLTFDLDVPGPQIAVRTCEDFFSRVHPDGDTCPGAAECPLVQRLPGGGVALPAYNANHQARFTFARNS